MVVVLGGLSDMAGALIGGLIVATVEVVGSYVVGTTWKEVLHLLRVIAILVRGPPPCSASAARRRRD